MDILKRNKMDRMQSGEYSDGLHQIIRLTYISQAVKNLKTNDLKNILAKARSKNQARGITGILVFNNTYFLQSIEGSRPIINDLLRDLSVDKRHFNLQVVHAEAIKARYWSQWFMDYVTPNASNRATFLKYSAMDRFNPYLMKAETINQMLIELSAPHEPLNAEPSAPSIDGADLNTKHSADDVVASPITPQAEPPSQRKIFGLF